MHDEIDEDDEIERDETQPTPEQEKLEAEYRKTVDKILPKINKHLADADKLIQKACDLADEHGIPFYGTSGITQNYAAENIPQLRDDEDANCELIEEITGASAINEYGDSGWAHSSVC